VHPKVGRVTLTTFRAHIVGGRSGTRAPVRTRITGSYADGASWTTVGCSADLIHASWLALADCFEYVIVGRSSMATRVEEVHA
jgi:2-isopropylmalate synthase